MHRKLKKIINAEDMMDALLSHDYLTQMTAEAIRHNITGSNTVLEYEEPDEVPGDKNA